MSELHIRRVGRQLIKDVNKAAIDAELTQREWILNAIERALDYAPTPADKLPARVAQPAVEAPPGVRPMHDPKTCRVHRCGLCQLAEKS